jgi:hypothetical protein
VMNRRGPMRYPRAIGHGYSRWTARTRNRCDDTGADSQTSRTRRSARQGPAARMSGRRRASCSTCATAVVQRRLSTGKTPQSRWSRQCPPVREP